VRVVPFLCWLEVLCRFVGAVLVQTELVRDYDAADAFVDEWLLSEHALES